MSVGGTVLALCTWLEATPLAVKITESEWLFPTIETVHVLALTLVVGSIVLLDLRLLGLANRNLGAMQLSDETLPWTWSAFVVAAITGTLMFVSAATKYYGNVPFRIKMVLLVLAGINMVVFHRGAWRIVHDWDRLVPTPRAVRAAAGLSLTFWIGVVVAGRWVGFV
ncbi:DUF6644 family protein [Sphingomonas bacterium]|uniref:DUF6644 family protein n=1 Tax=Sphingomonas bacterium TaxID=1895847 RepID=UPI001576674C|nr:DUF6644 family protein [Sphingomonas bacterium]